MSVIVVIVGDELANNIIELLQSDHDEVVENLMLETLNPPLDEGVQVGARVRLA